MIFKKWPFVWYACCSPDLSWSQEVPVREEMMGREPTEPMEALNLKLLLQCTVPVVSTFVDWIGMGFSYVSSGGGRSAFGRLLQLTCIWSLVWLSQFKFHCAWCRQVIFKTHYFCSGPFNNKESHKQPTERPEKDREKLIKKGQKRLKDGACVCKGLADLSAYSTGDRWV